MRLVIIHHYYNTDPVMLCRKAGIEILDGYTGKELARYYEFNSDLEQAQESFIDAMRAIYKDKLKISIKEVADVCEMEGTF